MTRVREPQSTHHPTRIVTTPMYIGFREIRYGPVVTRCRGGSQGAKVPRPATENSRTHHSKRNMPKQSGTAASATYRIGRPVETPIAMGKANATKPGRATKAATARMSIQLLGY